MRSLKHPRAEDLILSDVLRALGDPVRLEIVRMAEGCDGLPCNAFLEAIPKSTASHHWRVLREAGVIRQVPEGTSRRNFLRREDLEARFPGLLDAVLGSG
ncbi:MAG: helix-turn-helix domain-containing protein [Planctomycetota bacterium]